MAMRNGKQLFMADTKSIIRSSILPPFPNQRDADSGRGDQGDEGQPYQDEGNFNLAHWRVFRFGHKLSFLLAVSFR
jgi:hypothetical protein